MGFKLGPGFCYMASGLKHFALMLCQFPVPLGYLHEFL